MDADEAPDREEARLPPLLDELDAERLLEPPLDDELFFCVDAMGEILLSLYAPAGASMGRRMLAARATAPAIQQ